jgi:hypothetical protein
VAKVPTCHTRICGCIEQLVVAPVEKAGAAITTEWPTVEGAGGVWGVGVAWAAYIPCLAAVLRHWQALRLALL